MLNGNRETKPVIGQRQIHQRIQQLNFQDCHAKISQVDSQATLGNGVVVQVTGELSNNGQPMRRFTQTFVLAAQSPKKYYVHNDIFRYQVLHFILLSSLPKMKVILIHNIKLISMVLEKQSNFMSAYKIKVFLTLNNTWNLVQRQTQKRTCSAVNSAATSPVYFIQLETSLVIN